MHLSDHVNTFGRYLKSKYGLRVHKLAINAGLSCPNRDGTKGYGGCTFCNNTSFSPVGDNTADIAQQLDSGRAVIRRRTGAIRYLAYFQAYTNTYADIDVLQRLYDAVLQQPDVIGLAVGTRPDCVPDAVLRLLATYRDRGKEVWLELGLQSAFDATLKRVNRGHGFAEYADAVRRAKKYQLNICCHLIVGLPGEQPEHSLVSAQRVMDVGVQGFKIHPLHVVKNTALAKQWQRGEYRPLSMQSYVGTVSEIILQTPGDVVFHRLTATARDNVLLAPLWCGRKWPVLNAITAQLEDKLQLLSYQLTPGTRYGTCLSGRQPARA